MFLKLVTFIDSLFQNENNFNDNALDDPLDDILNNDTDDADDDADDADDTDNTDFEQGILQSINPSSSPSIEVPEFFSRRPSMVPTLRSSNIPTITPTITPTQIPTEDISESWKKTFHETGKVMKLSGTGNTLLIIKGEGLVYIYERHSISKSWSQVNVTDIVSNVWGDLSMVSDDLSCEISTNGDIFVVGNQFSGEVAIFFFDPITSIWYQHQNVITESSIGQFGSLVDISFDGRRVLAGGSNGLMLYELENNGWVKTGSILYMIDSFTFYSVNMNDEGTNVIVNVQDHDGYYYDRTRTVKRYSLPSFEEFPDYPIDPFLTVIEVSTTNDGNIMALTIFDHNDYYEYDDYYYPKNDVHVYKFDPDTNEFNLISIMDGYFALSDSLSGDGSSLITVDPFRSPETGEFIFRSHKFEMEDFVETGFAAPDEGDENSIGLSISEDGSIYALIFGDIITIWEKRVDIR